MKIAVFSIESGDDVKRVIDKIFDLSINKNVSYQIYSELYKSLNLNNHSLFNNHSDLDPEVDLMISIGGDGTFLRTLDIIRDKSIPVLGINTGRLGFLATENDQNISKFYNDILNSNYEIEERSTLEVKVLNSKVLDTVFCVGLNEISIVRKNTTSLINIKTKLDGEFLNSYWSDGLIVSTPTGSTGYSLSCGGPIVSPNSNSLILTPISPHNLNARPIVISDKTKIEINVSGREDFHLLSIDTKIISLKQGMSIIIEKSPIKFKLVNIDGNSYYETLREKLFWGKDKRN